MVIMPNNNENGQSSYQKTGKHPYIMVVDREEEMVLIIKHALELELEEGEHVTNNNSVEEASIAQKIRRLFNKLASADESAENNTTPLSPRQTQILNQIAKGHPNKWIARSLGISEQTVKNHVTSIMDKLDANDRTHAVVLAMLNGWLKIEDVSEVRAEPQPEPVASAAKS
jgi:DNA-binding NarL/FixJ family response regulator